MSNTVAAISTPVAAGGIGVIRISGSKAAEIADKVVKITSGRPVTSMKGYTAAHGRVFLENEAIDECVVLFFKGPKSYTGEDVVEISCHGGILVVNRVLEAVLNAGALPAGPGEFTKRAFLNGKMDLSEAEGVMALIGAAGNEGMKAAMNTLDGALSRKINALKERLVALAAHMSAWVDYPDEDIEEIDFTVLRPELDFVADELSAMLSRFDAGKAITEGVETAIVGKPNVGKSALMNMLSGFERSIVTDVAGTTRDVVEQTVRLGSVILRLADTAGIRSSQDKVESIGVDLARTRIERATLILAVFDGSSELDEKDKEIFSLCVDKRVVAIVNKSDLPCMADCEYIEKMFPGAVYLSAATGEGEAELIRAVESVLGTDKVDVNMPMLITGRQKLSARSALDCVKEAVEAIDCGMTMDAVNVCIDSAIEQLLSLTGEKAKEAVVNEVFAQFCVGK